MSKATTCKKGAPCASACAAGGLAGRSAHAAAMATEQSAANFKASAPSDLVIPACRRPVKKYPTSAQATGAQRNTLPASTPASLTCRNTMAFTSGSVAAKNVEYISIVTNRLANFSVRAARYRSTAPTTCETINIHWASTQRSAN